MRLFSLLACGLPLLAGPLLAQDGGPFLPDSVEPPARVARIAYLQGDVSFQAADDTLWSAATLNYPVTTGDRLFAGPDARAELELGPCTVRLGDYADVTVINLTDHLLQLGASQGAMRVSVYELGPDDTVEVDTPHGALVLQAPGRYRIVAGLGDTALVASVERGGSLEWTAGGVAHVVGSGQAILVSGYDPIQIASVAPPAQDDFDRWSTTRDLGVEKSASARYVSRDIPGYQDLDAAGTWRTEATYGQVWFPTAIPAGWVPYRFGHWEWIPPWGWTWIEDAPWGYAPFHYGRWVYLHARWGWVPGPRVARPYYAPALVVFVGGSALGPRAHGWFPLGPGEPYYPWYRHDRRYLERVNLTNLHRVGNPAMLTDASYISRIQYRNRRSGTTVVPEDAFRSRESLARQVMRVRSSAITRATVAPRPMVKPEPRRPVGAGGRVERRPPAPERPTWVVTPAPRAPAPRGQPRPAEGPKAGPAHRERPVIITRTPPPGIGRREVPRPKAPEPAAGPRRREEPAPRPQPGAAPQAEPGHGNQGGRGHHAEAEPAPKPAPGDQQAPTPRAGQEPKPRTQPAPKPRTQPTPPTRNRPQPQPAQGDTGRRRGSGG
jgi:hypothetical protein